MKQIILSAVLFCVFACTSKVKYGSIGNYQVILENSKADIYVLMLPGKDKFEISKKYTSYKNNKINTTQGASDGKLLHGKYKESYFDGNIKSLGHFKNGLKSGNWNSYNEDGQISSSLEYKKGDTISPVLLYNKKGIVTDTILSAKDIKKSEKKNSKKKFKLFKKKSSVVNHKDSI